MRIVSFVPTFSQLIGYSNPKNQTAINAVNKFASQLAARFNPTVGCTRSWDNAANPTNFQVTLPPARRPFAQSADSESLPYSQVIIDNMMNLEVLFVSADLTGNNTLRTIATTHADTTIRNHIRPDGTCLGFLP